MSRATTWKGLAVAVGLILAAAVICIAAGNTSLASALIVVAAIEGLAHAVFITIGSARRRRRESTIG